MGLRDVIGWFVKVSDEENEDGFDPGPLAHDIKERQDKLERLLEERKRRRDIVRAQVRGLKGAR